MLLLSDFTFIEFLNCGKFEVFYFFSKLIFVFSTDVLSFKIKVNLQNYLRKNLTATNDFSIKFIFKYSKKKFLNL